MDFKKFEALCLLLFAMNVIQAHAEGGICPSGYYPIGGGASGWSGCAPIPSRTEDASEATDPGPRWQSKWGSVAVDGRTGGFGGSSAQSSKKNAEKLALSECRGRGGSHCVVVKSVRNTCEALAWGDSKYSVQWRSTEDAAKTEAMRDCNERTQNCDLIFSGCSYPERAD